MYQKTFILRPLLASVLELKLAAEILLLEFLKVLVGEHGAGLLFRLGLGNYVPLVLGASN